MMDFVFKMMDFVFKMESAQRRLHYHRLLLLRRLPVTTDCFMFLKKRFNAAHKQGMFLREILRVTQCDIACVCSGRR